ncbi:hypothetical protein OH784_28910 [Ectobacillus funiculus]|uniref:hypothetical protein n=1 Tax=Ectobacillus funiculus TaxID=137993 RepID=UPI00397B2712
MEKRLQDSKKGYRDFKDRTDHEGIVIRDSYVYFIERDEKHFADLNGLKEYFIVKGEKKI